MYTFIRILNAEPRFVGKKTGIVPLSLCIFVVQYTRVDSPVYVALTMGFVVIVAGLTVLAAANVVFAHEWIIGTLQTCVFPD